MYYFILVNMLLTQLFIVYLVVVLAIIIFIPLLFFNVVCIYTQLHIVSVSCEKQTTQPSKRL